MSPIPKTYAGNNNAFIIVRAIPISAYKFINFETL